jgi:hypothetical protein
MAVSEDPTPVEETPVETVEETPAEESKPEGSKTEDLAERLGAIEQALQSGNQTPAEIQALQNAVHALAGQIQAIQATNAAGRAEPQTPGADLDELAKDPRGMIRKEAGAAVMKGLQALVPHLKSQAEQMRDILLTEHVQTIDTEFGKGAFAELFAPEIKPILDKMPLEMQASREHVDAVMSAVFGQVMRNQEKFGKLQERKAETVKAAQASPGMMSGARARGKGPSISVEEREFLSRLARSGIEMDPKEYVAAREAGRSEADWPRAKAARSGR